MLTLQGVRVLGYLFWTISDNWEWADGYGPKFGLVAVDRLNDLARIPRPSYHLFTKVRPLYLFNLNSNVLSPSFCSYHSVLDDILDPR